MDTKHIKRRLLGPLKEHLKEKEISLIVGPRQAGKTTLMEELRDDLVKSGEKTIFLNPDFDEDKRFFVSQKALLQRVEIEFGKEKGFVFLDEIQRREDAGLFLKGLYDMHTPYKFIVSGSGSVELKEKVHESLMGRKLIFELYPVSFYEFAEWKTEYRYGERISEIFSLHPEETIRLLEEYMLFGGYPRVLLADTMEKKQPIIGGEILDFTYGDCQKEMDMINKAYIEIMTNGDRNGRVFTFPIPTYNLTKDFDWDNENAQALFEMSAKFGTPYFQNFLNSSLNPSDVRSMCCRLQLDLRELRARGGGLFGSAEMTGSVGVVTINLPRIGYLSDTKEQFLARLGKLMDLAKNSLEIKRKVVGDNIERGLLPYTKRYLPNLHAHFSTIGLNGMNEAMRNFFGKDTDLSSKEGRDFALEILNFMRERLADYQEETGNLYNLEATPAEGTTYRFAKEDQKRFPGILQAGTREAPYYTNSSHLQVGTTDNPLDALDHQDELQTKYTGGTVLHLFLGERLRDWKTARNFVKKVAENYRLPYFTLTPTFSVCPTHGYLNGEVPKCPTCDAECEVWSRIVGYHRPVSQWNHGKKSEYAERKEYIPPMHVNKAETVVAKPAVALSDYGEVKKKKTKQYQELSAFAKTAEKSETA